MSLTIRIFSFLKNSKEFLQNSSLQKYFIFSLSFFLILGVFLNSYAVDAGDESTKYDPIEMYQDMDEFSSASTTVDGKHSHKSQGFGMVDFVVTGLDAIYPQGNANYASIVENPNISPATKMGFIGYVDAPVSAMLYNPPYIDIPEHLAQEWVPNYAPTAGVYAEDKSGYEQLMKSNIVDLWTAVRNIAYMFFVVVFIAAGFMIMFRHKIGGQTMVTVYNTLPNIIVSLILVTFSFAIVGFMIDIGAVLIRVIEGFVNVEVYVDGSSLLGTWVVYSSVTTFQVMTTLMLSVETILGYVAVWAIASLIGGIALLILAVIVLYISIKIFFTLIKAYIGILFDTIAAPMVFAIAAIPGRQAVMKDWFVRVTKNVLVFVIVFFLLHIPLYFVKNGTVMHLLYGDLRGGTGEGILDGTVMAGVTLYCLFLAPSVPKMLDEYFPKPSGGAAGQAGAEGAKAQASKIPLVGGFFKS